MLKMARRGALWLDALVLVYRSIFGVYWHMMKKTIFMNYVVCILLAWNLHAEHSQKKCSLKTWSSCYTLQYVCCILVHNLKKSFFSSLMQFLVWKFEVMGRSACWNQPEELPFKKMRQFQYITVYLVYLGRYY